jgi:hypothetical protein
LGGIAVGAVLNPRHVEGIDECLSLRYTRFDPAFLYASDQAFHAPAIGHLGGTR